MSEESIEFRAGLMAGSVSTAVILLAVFFVAQAAYGLTVVLTGSSEPPPPTHSERLAELYLEMRPGIVRLDSLDAIAAQRVAYMQRTEQYSHEGHLTPECLAWGYRSGRHAWVGLLNSPPHRRVLFDEKYTRFGVASGWLKTPRGEAMVWVVVLEQSDS